MTLQIQTLLEGISFGFGVKQLKSVPHLRHSHENMMLLGRVLLGLYLWQVGGLPLSSFLEVLVL